MLFDGNWISKGNTPVYLAWLADVSFMGHGVRAVMKNEYSGMTFRCTALEKSTGGCVESGDDVVKIRELDDVDISQTCWILFMFCIIYRVISYFGLRFLYTGKSWKESCSS